MERTGVRARRLATLSVAGVLIVGLARGAAGAGQPGDARAGRPGPRVVEATGRTYVVRPGDTLWAIAARIAGPTADPRPVVDAIVEANLMDPGALVPGQRIVLPGA
ncbi:MAG: LysM peptidoglycan-binding domain-containing protein [Actinobacteria bacterium]|nr:LysM peptidoglycan-binding domain-containing protein [Actinomycetota bacterium]